MAGGGSAGAVADAVNARPTREDHDVRRDDVHGQGADPVRRVGRHGGRLLRPGQDGHRPCLDGGLRQAALPGRPALPLAPAPGALRPARLPLPGRRRGPHGQDARGGPPGHRRLVPGPHPVPRARDPRGGHRADHLRGGPRAHPPPPGRGAQGLHRLRLARGDRRPPGPLPRRRRRHRHPAEGGRARPLLGRGGLLLLRPHQGRGHGGGRRARRHRSRRLLRLLRLHHRRADARRGRPPRRGQPRPGAGPGRRRPGLGGPGLRAARQDARPGVDADPGPDGGHQRRPGRDRGRGGRVLAAAPRARAHRAGALGADDPGPDATNGPTGGPDRPAPTSD